MNTWCELRTNKIAIPVFSFSFNDLDLIKDVENGIKNKTWLN